MSSDLHLVADIITKGRAYPAFARWQARPYTPSWREFGQHWPFTTPLRLEEYCNQHGLNLYLHTLDDIPDCKCFYPVCLGFFDFTIDYLALLSPQVKSLIASNQLVLLFMYHEGDNPWNIKLRLDSLCTQHGLPADCYKFVSSNSRADRLKNFITFVDFELWYYQRNLSSAPVPVHSIPRNYDFVCLSRLHKSWRATVMTDLRRHGALDQSLWSYCQPPLPDSEENDNPIQIDTIPQLRRDTGIFLSEAPFYADDLDDQQRNDHSLLVERFFSDAYCNIVIESQFDVDRSSGCFLTEKTFKPIKHGQLFFVVGGAGSLAALRELGYHTFDHVLDTRYDDITDTTDRWLTLREAILTAKQQGLHNLYQQAIPDIEHNQRLFCANKLGRLNTLVEKILA